MMSISYWATTQSLEDLLKYIKFHCIVYIKYLD